MSATNPVNAYLEALVGADGSDLHLNSGALPTIRTHGRIVRVRRDEANHVCEISPDELRVVILATMPAHLHGRWESEREVDYSYDAGAGIGRFRVNAYFDLDGPAAVFRRVPAPPTSMDDVGLPPSVQALVDQPNGLILLIGPTGAGKSTTMAALVNEVNSRRAGVILTIEEPIEFAYPRDRGCVVSQREVGTHTLSFAAATRSGLRQDPDVIGVGEIRDPETLAQVLGLAETGHLVFSTGHGSSVASGLGRLLGLPEAAREDATRRQLAGVFRAVIAQALVPRADGEGRLPAFEVLHRTTSTVNKIRDGNLVSLRSDMNDRASGMVTLERSLAELVVRGEVREEDAFMHSNDPDQLRSELRAAMAGSY
jgi:twitching motility protein PilT